jgi:hypothetical protein
MGGSLVHDLQNVELGSVSSSAREKMKRSFAPGVPERGGVWRSESVREG